MFPPELGRALELPNRQLRGCIWIHTGPRNRVSYYQEVRGSNARPKGEFYTVLMNMSWLESNDLQRSERSKSTWIQADPPRSTRFYQTNLGVTSVSHVGTNEGGFGWYGLDD